MSKIFFSNRVEHLIQICKKVNTMKDKNLNPAGFLKYMITGIQDKNTVIFISFGEDKKMNGCSVLTIVNSMEGTFLWIDFVWIKPGEETLGQEFLTAVEKVAKELEIKKIMGRMTGRFKAAEKVYGFIESYRVIEKVLK